MGKKLCFVYGTLKKNESNNEYFLGDAEFVKNARTRPLYRIYDNGRFPMMVEDKHNGTFIEGEIWRVTDEEINGMDYLEGHPNFYRRQFIEIEGMSEPVQGYIFQGDVQPYEDCSPVWRRHGKKEED